MSAPVKRIKPGEVIPAEADSRKMAGLALVEDEKMDHAVRAYRAATELTPLVNAFVRALTRRPEVKVQWSAGTPRTDGTIIYLRPPYVLGEPAVPHPDRNKCAERLDNDLLWCPACRRVEEVMQVLFHEISHITEDSFTRLTEKEKTDAVKRGLAERLRARDTAEIEKAREAKLIEMIEANYGKNFMGAAALVSDYLPALVNALEDARVNARTFERRKGTKRMYRGAIRQVIETGFDLPDGTHIDWKEQEPEVQAPIALLLKASGYDELLDGFHPLVLEAVNSLEVVLALQGLAESRSPATPFRIAPVALEAFRARGLMRRRDDVEDDPMLPPPPPPSGEPEKDEDEKPKGEESEDAPKGDEPSDDKSEESEAPGQDDDAENKRTSDQDDDEEVDSDDDGEQTEDTGRSKSDDGDGEDDGAEDDTFSESVDGEDEDDASEDAGDDGEGKPGDGDGSDGDGSDDDDDEGDEGSGDSDGEGSSSGSGEGDEDGSGGDDEGDGFKEAETSGDDVDALVGAFGGHGPLSSEDDVDPDFDRVIDVLVAQGEFFDEPSKRIANVRISRYGVPTLDSSGYDITSQLPWRGCDGVEAIGDRLENKSVVVPEAILTDAVARGRTVFSLNARGRQQTGLKSGRPNGRVLHRVALGDDKIFRKRHNPGRRDYFVGITLDMSGSTSRKCKEQPDLRRDTLIKTTALGMAELLNRVGVKFALYSHTATYSGDSGSTLSLDMGEIKSPTDPWGDKQREALTALRYAAANLDGHTLEFMRKLVEKQRATDKVILYFTDGAMPAENGAEELEILYREFKRCQDKGITMIYMGIDNTEPRDKYGLPTIPMYGMQDLPKAVEALKEYLHI